MKRHSENCVPVFFLSGLSLSRYQYLFFLGGGNDITTDSFDVFFLNFLFCGRLPLKEARVLKCFVFICKSQMLHVGNIYLDFPLNVAVFHISCR